MFTKEQADEIISIIKKETFVKAEDSFYTEMTLYKRFPEGYTQKIEIEVYQPCKSSSKEYKVRYSFYDTKGEYVSEKSARVYLAQRVEQDARIISAIEARMREEGGYEEITEEENELRRSIREDLRGTVAAGISAFLSDKERSKDDNGS